MVLPVCSDEKLSSRNLTRFGLESDESSQGVRAGTDIFVSFSTSFLIMLLFLFCKHYILIFFKVSITINKVIREIQQKKIRKLKFIEKRNFCEFSTIIFISLLYIIF